MDVQTDVPISIVGRSRRFANNLFNQYRKWIFKAGFALGDQAIFAGANFVINVLLARWMVPDEYGAFVVAYSWFLLALQVYDGMLMEPMTIFGSGKYADRMNKYLGFIYRGHVGISLLLALVLGLSVIPVARFDSPLVALAMLGIALATPFIMTRWMTRLPFYVMMRPHLAMVGGIAYFIVALVLITVLHNVPVVNIVLPASLSTGDLGGLFWIQINTLLSPLTAALALGAASTVSSFLLTVLFLKPSWNLQDDKITARGLLKDHWGYGRWATATRILTWFPSNLQYIVLPIVIGLSASAALRAMMNLVLPVYMAITAMISILAPFFVRRYRAEGKEGLLRVVRKILILGVAVTGAYCFVITVFGAWIIDLLFAGKYNEFATLPFLFTMGLLPVSTVVTIILDASLRSTGHVRQSFQANVIPAISWLTLGVALLAIFGIIGANLGSLVNSGIAISLMVMYIRRIPPGLPPSDDEETPAADSAPDPAIEETGT